MGSFNPIKIISSAVKAVAGAVSSVVSGVTKVLHTVGKAVGDVASFVMEPVADVVTAVMDPIAGVMEGIMSPVANAIGDVGEWVEEGIQKYGKTVILSMATGGLGAVGGFLLSTAIDVAETGELDLERALVRAATQVASGALELPDNIPGAEKTDFLSKISEGSSFSDIINAGKEFATEVIDDPMKWMAAEAERQAYNYAAEEFSERTGLPVTPDDLKTLKNEGAGALFDKKVNEGKASIEEKTAFLEKAADGRLDPDTLIEKNLKSMGDPEAAERMKFSQSMKKKIEENPEFYRGKNMEDLMKDKDVMMNLSDEELKHAPNDALVHMQEQNPDRFNTMLKNDPVMARDNATWLSKQDGKTLADMDLDEDTLYEIEIRDPYKIDEIRRHKEVSTMSEEKKGALKTQRDAFYDQTMQYLKDQGNDWNDPRQRTEMQAYIEDEWNNWGRKDAIDSIKNTDERLKGLNMSFDEMERHRKATKEAEKNSPGILDYIKSGGKAIWKGAKDFLGNPDAVKLAAALGMTTASLLGDGAKKFLAIDQEKTKIDNLNEDAFREKITGKGPQEEVRKKQMATLDAMGARARGETPSIARTEMQQAQDRALKQQLGAVKGMRGVGAGAKLRGLERASGASRAELAEKGSLAAAKERLAAEQAHVTGLGGVRQTDADLAKAEKTSLETMRKQQLAERQKERQARIVAAEARRERQRKSMSAGAQMLGSGVNIASGQKYKTRGPQSLAEMAEGAGKKGIKKLKSKLGLDKLGFQDGGPIYGPGSETSDSIPARLSDGEFVVKASAVRGLGQQMGGQNPQQDRRKGVKFLDSLQEQMGRVGERRGEMKKFGGGGPVKGKEPRKTKNQLLRERQKLEGELRAAGVRYDIKKPKKKKLTVDELIDMGWAEGGEAYVRPKKAFAEAIGHSGEAQFKDKALKDAKKGGSKRRFITHYAEGGKVSFKDVIKARNKKEQDDEINIDDLDWWVESVTD